MQKILIVVDMQNDFIDGALGTKEAVTIVPKVEEKIRNFKGTVLFTRDTHETWYLDTQEGKKLPVPHCIRDTEGWQIIPEINPEGLSCNLNIAMDKKSFGTLDWENEGWLDQNRRQHGYDIEIIGVCTDICVVSNALILKAAFPENKITVDASCCAGSTPEKHKAALEVMKSCQIEVIGE